MLQVVRMNHMGLSEGSEGEACALLCFGHVISQCLVEIADFVSFLRRRLRRMVVRRAETLHRFLIQHWHHLVNCLACRTWVQTDFFGESGRYLGRGLTFD